ncbi:MAG: agmatinase family protein [Bacteroidia bacterium]
MSKADKIRDFDPNGPGQLDLNIYGLPFTREEADIVLVSVPWEVTVSYGGGTLLGPESIMEASLQVDLYDSDAPEAWKSGIFMTEPDASLKSLSEKSRSKAEKYISALMEGAHPAQYATLIEEIDAACNQMIAFVKQQTASALDEGKITGLVGGDHSTPFGFMQALAERHQSFGILQIDAHMDLRSAYEGFTYSHASIMYNALQIPQVSKLVQVGIRDYCAEEIEVMQAQGMRVQTFFDDKMKQRVFDGESWKHLCNEIVASLPEKVYVSFDIDGLDPVLCPNTGTPVPGGLSYQEAVYLLRTLAASGKQIIGFDLNEVSPGESDWDANVASRLLYKLCVFAGKSRGLF